MFELADFAAVAARNDEASVRAEALATDYCEIDVREATLRVAKLLLLREPSWAKPEVEVVNLHDTPIERWAARLRERGLGYRAVMLGNWVTARQGALPNYALYLYNADYRRTRAILEYLLTGERWAPPYLKLVLLNLLHQAVGLSHDEMHEMSSKRFRAWVPWVNRLFYDDAAFEWFARKPQPIRFYGGVTNTVLGLYDDIFADPEVGAAYINRDCDLCFDLGGGFSTSETERLLGRACVSADLMTPRMRDYDGELIILDRRFDERTPVADQATRDAYLERQERVAHQRFDVFEDQFPTAADSYTIVSTGFMTSTLRPQPVVGEDVMTSRLGTIATSVHAILRVMELVALGKSVDLFTIQRATSRVYRYKTCLLQWRDGRLARLQTTVDPRSVQWEQGFGEISGIQPESKHFAKFIEVPPADRSATGL